MRLTDDATFADAIIFPLVNKNKKEINFETKRNQLDEDERN